MTAPTPLVRPGKRLLSEPFNHLISLQIKLSIMDKKAKNQLELNDNRPKSKPALIVFPLNNHHGCQCRHCR